MNFKKLLTAMTGTALILTPALSVTACNTKVTTEEPNPKPDINKIVSLKGISTIGIPNREIIIADDYAAVTPAEIKAIFKSVVLNEVSKLGNAAVSAQETVDFSYEVMKPGANPADPPVALATNSNLTAELAPARTFIVKIRSTISSKKIIDDSGNIPVELPAVPAKIQLSTLTTIDSSDADAKRFFISPYTRVNYEQIANFLNFIVNRAVNDMAKVSDALLSVDFGYNAKTGGDDSKAIDSSTVLSFTSGVDIVITITAPQSSQKLTGATGPITVTVPALTAQF